MSIILIQRQCLSMRDITNQILFKKHLKIDFFAKVSIISGRIKFNHIKIILAF